MIMSKKAFLLVFVSILFSPSYCEHIFAPQNFSSCNGAFDVYFVLDFSSSLLQNGINHFKEETVSFVKKLVNKFTNPNLRFALITFNNVANVVMPLTEKRETVETKLMELRRAIPDGNTNLYFGLEKVNNLIKVFGRQRASVVILLTDGILHYADKRLSVEKAALVRSRGATVIAVGVANTDPKQLLDIVGGHKQLLFEAASFQGLQKIVTKVVDQSCVEITESIVDMKCTNSSHEIHVHGRGFNKTGTYKNVRCRIILNTQQSFLVSPIAHSPVHLTCVTPPDILILPDEDRLTIEVTLDNGVSYISSNVTVTINSCRSGDGLSTASVVFLLLLLIFALFFLWWFSKVLCCKQDETQNVEPKPSRVMPPPPPLPPLPQVTVIETQQWPTVDASYYGGRGAGGINPLKVTWGEHGCTDAGMLLERAKDAKEVGFVTRQISVQRQSTPSHSLTKPPEKTCCGSLNFFSSLITIYNGVAVRRPSTKDIKNCTFIKSPHGNRKRERTSDVSLTAGYLDTSN